MDNVADLRTELYEDEHNLCEFHGRMWRFNE